MKQAATTWALVVGIDEYDDQSFKRLTGAARDAAAAVRWLRALGVPDEHILLHATPNAAAASEVGDLGLAVKGCTEPEIWQSVHTLSSKSGSRLFVFLSGHGLYEPGSKRLFLTQEATEGSMTNLGIELYSDLFRSLNFPMQFLVMDGCLNLPYTPAVRSTVQAALHAGVAPKVPRADTTLTSCFAAGQGELALEAGDRGMFLEAFLQTLDPAAPHPQVVDFDDEAGEVRLDVRCAVLDVVSPTVTQRARAEFSRGQHPGLQVHGLGEAWGTVPIVVIQPERTARVRVVVDPTIAVPDVRQIRIDSDETAWRRFVPVPPANEVRVPVDCHLPAGTSLSVRCLLRPQAPWSQPGLQPVVADQDREVIIRLQPPASAPSADRPATVTVRAVDPMGQAVLALGDDHYRVIKRSIGPERHRITVERHETGPVLHAAPGDRDLLSSVAARIARAINRTTPHTVSAVVLSQVPLTEAAIRLLLPEGGAARLAGLLQDTPTMAVGDQQMSLRAAQSAETVTVEPGPVRIRLQLPWGSWSSLVHVDEGETAIVRLPESVGIPPLRVRVAGAEPGAYPEHAVVVLDAGPETRADAVQPLTGASIGEAEAVAASGATMRIFGLPSSERWRAAVIVDDGSDALVLPLHPDAPVLLSLQDGPRAEPLSTVPSTTWDLLVASGRLDALSDDDMEELTWAKWEDPILGLAGAYACFGQERHSYLSVVLDNLASLDPRLPDITVLTAAMLHAIGDDEDRVHERLTKLAENGAIPVLRWGVPLAVNAADRHGLQGWAERLAVVDASLLASSVWTLWRPSPDRPSVR